MNASAGAEQEITEAAAAFLRRRATREVVRATVEGGTGHDASLWRDIVSLGWCGLTVPEAHGGLGLGLRALVALESGSKDGEWVVRYAVATAMERIAPRLQELEDGRHRALSTLHRLADEAQEEAPVVCLRARLALSRLSSP